MIIVLLFILFILIHRLHTKPCYPLTITGGYEKPSDIKDWNNLWKNEQFVNLVKDVMEETITIHPLNIKDIKESFPYTRNTAMLKNGCHRGQRKLFLTELFFFTKYPKARYVIYAGAAPSRKLGLLQNFMPDTKFILIDPNDFSIVIEDNKTLLKRDFSQNFVNSSFMYGENKKVLWLYDNYEFQWNRGGNDIVSQYNISKNKIEKVSRGKKTMENINKTIYDIDLNKDKKIIDRYHKLIVDSDYKYFIIQGLCTIDLCKILRAIFKNVDIYFWTDIRTIVEEDLTGWDTRVEITKGPTDTDIIWNNAQNYAWTRILKPKAYMLKYRAPYYEDTPADFDKHIKTVSKDIEYCKNEYDLDFIDNYSNKKFIWLGGEIYVQPYAPLASAECRIIGELIPSNYKVEYNTKLHEDKMFYFNKVLREFSYCDNKYITPKNTLSVDIDSLMEVKIWEDYINNIDKKINIQDAIVLLNHVVGYCYPRRVRVTWINYKQKILKKLPWQIPFLPNKL